MWHTTHNSLTLLSSEAGIPALILYVMILWCGFRNLRAAMRLTRGHTESSALVRGMYASFCGYLVGSLFLSWAYLFLPYILVAYTTPLLSIARKSFAQVRNGESPQKAEDDKRSTMPALGRRIVLFHHLELCIPGRMELSVDANQAESFQILFIPCPERRTSEPSAIYSTR